MTTLDRTFIGVAGALLMSALVARTVAQQPSSAPNVASRPSASLIVNADPSLAEAYPATGNAQTKPHIVQTADATGAGAQNGGKAGAGTPESTKNTNPPQKMAVGASSTGTQTSTTAQTTPSKPNSGKAGTNQSSAQDNTAAKAASAKQSGAAPPADKPLVEQDGDVVIRALGAIYDEGHDIARVTKDVHVTQEGQDFVLTCQNLVYDRGLNRAVATGDVKIEGRDTTITGDKLEGDFYRKVVVMTGNVDVRSRGKGDGMKSDDAPATESKGNGTASNGAPDAPVSRTKPSRMTCDRVEYNYETRDAVVTGHIQLTQEGSAGTCDKILFDEENNIVTLAGHALFVNTQGQTLKGPTVKIWLDSGMARADQVEITMKPNQTPAPRATKATVEAPPTIDELANELKPTPTGKPAAATTPAPAPPAAPSDSGTHNG